jgi:hypothetical protein
VVLNCPAIKNSQYEDFISRPCSEIETTSGINKEKYIITGLIWAARWALLPLFEAIRSCSELPAVLTGWWTSQLSDEYEFPKIPGLTHTVKTRIFFILFAIGI